VVIRCVFLLAMLARAGESRAQGAARIPAAPAPWGPPPLVERVERFHSHITVEEDGTLRVRENIRVVGAGRKIGRGVERRLPFRLGRPAAPGADGTLFFHLLKAPTAAGRELLDRIARHRRFVATPERWYVLPGQPAAAETLARHLPHALALDLEREWAGRFDEPGSDAPPWLRAALDPRFRAAIASGAGWLVR
jgi:hypothetical protein